MLATAPLCVAGPAWAQVGLSASLQSDYQYRGHSLSDRRPVVGLSLSYDHPSGAYAGVSLSAPDASDSERRLAVIDYAGYARRLMAGLALDVGVTDANIISYKVPKRRVEYQEVYAGLIGDHVSFHAHYSPNYLHTGSSTLYADLAGAVRPTPDTRLFAHFGALTPLVGPQVEGSRKVRYDASLGVARRFQHAELSLSWTTTFPAVVLANGQGQDRDTLVVGAAYFF